MSTDLLTPDGEAIRGWLLRCDPDEFDAHAMFAEFGRVWRHPVEDGPLAALLEAGQPCFVVSLDRSRVTGLWGIGEVVAPVTTVTVEADGVVTESTFAEVEVLPLAKGIGFAKLAAVPNLAGTALVESSSAPRLVPLGPAVVRAIEGLELDLVPPTAEQDDHFDSVLGAEDDGLVLQVFGTDRSIAVFDGHDDDGLLLVALLDDEADDAEELGRVASMDEAIALVGGGLHRLVLGEPVDLDDPDAEIEPVAMLRVDDGFVALFRTSEDRFELHDPMSPNPDDGGPIGFEHLATFESLQRALAGLAAAIEEVHDDED